MVAEIGPVHSPVALAARDLAFGYKRERAPVLAGVSITAETGLRTALIGPNGSGKSTLLRLLGGLLTPSAGAVELDGTPIAAIPSAERARRVAYLPQFPTLAFPYPVGAYVRFGRYARGRHGLEAKADRAIASVGLHDRRDDPVGELSVGQRQRASIARALCQLDDEPSPGVTRVLLADEPTAALDPRHDLEARALFDRLAREGIAVVAALHDLAAAAAFDRVLLLGEGGIPVASGTPHDVLAEGPLRSAFGVVFEPLRSPSGRLAGLVPVAEGVSDHSRTNGAGPTIRA